MSLRRITMSVAGAVLLSCLAIAADGRRNTAWAEEFGALCLGTSGTLCRTVTVQICQEWQLNSLTGGLTGAGLGSTCKMWITHTYYYYYENSGGGGTSSKPGLK